MVAYLDNVIVRLLPEHSKNPVVVKALVTWLQRRLQPLGVKLSRRKSNILFSLGTNVPI